MFFKISSFRDSPLNSLHCLNKNRSSLKQFVKLTLLEQNKIFPCNMSVRINCIGLLINKYRLYQPFRNSAKQSGRSCKRGPNYTLQSHASFTGTVINLNSALSFTHISRSTLLTDRRSQMCHSYRVNTASRP